MDDSAVRLLVNADTWKYRPCAARWNLGPGRAAARPAARWAVSAYLPICRLRPTQRSGNDTIATALTYAAGPGRGFTQAVWRGVRLIRDVYTSNHPRIKRRSPRRCMSGKTWLTPPAIAALNSRLRSHAGTPLHLRRRAANQARRRIAVAGDNQRANRRLWRRGSQPVAGQSRAGKDVAGRMGTGC